MVTGAIACRRPASTIGLARSGGRGWLDISVLRLNTSVMAGFEDQFRPTGSILCHCLKPTAILQSHSPLRRCRCCRFGLPIAPRDTAGDRLPAVAGVGYPSFVLAWWAISRTGW